MSVLPPTLRHYVIDRAVTERTQAFLRDRGSEGYEAVVLWLGQPIDAETAAVFIEYAPAQIGYRTEYGVAVEVPQDALSELISALPEDLFVLIRVHSHPTDAYHSPQDDRNRLIGHYGAISIVVPYFAARPFDLHTCSVNELRPRDGWVELTAAEVEDRFEIR